MIKVKISHADFLTVFSKRRFTIGDKVLRNIYVIEDDDGNYWVNETTSITGVIAFIAVAIVAVIPVILYAGLKEVPELAKDSLIVLSMKPLRQDNLHHGAECTVEILKLAGIK